MLEQDVAIGDYFEFGDENFGIKKDTRESMIKLMERLCDIKAYKEDTLYLSISLADRYLLYLAKANKPATTTSWHIRSMRASMSSSSA